METLYSTIYYSKYLIELNIDKSTQYAALWTHKRHPIPRPFGRAMECFLWVLQQILIVLLRVSTVYIYTERQISQSFTGRWPTNLRVMGHQQTQYYLNGNGRIRKYKCRVSIDIKDFEYISLIRPYDTKWPTRLHEFLQLLTLGSFMSLGHHRGFHVPCSFEGSDNSNAH